jgi:hypothetical protein
MSEPSFPDYYYYYEYGCEYEYYGEYGSDFSSASMVPSMPHY